MRISDWSSDVCSSDLDWRHLLTSKNLWLGPVPACAMVPGSRSLRSLGRDDDLKVGGRQDVCISQGQAPVRQRYVTLRNRPTSRGPWLARSEERRVGEGCVSQGSTRGSLGTIKKKNI